MEYQYAAFYVFPPEELRQKYDPKSRSYCDAYISLTVPLPKLLDSSDLKLFGEALATIKSFELTYGSPSSYPGIPGVVYRFSESK